MCGIAGLINHQGEREKGCRIKKAIVLQNDRGNGLGAGFAAYGIYPHYQDFYALHVMTEESGIMKEVEKYIKLNFIIQNQEPIPLWNKKVKEHPFFQRFFVQPRLENREEQIMNDDDYTVSKVMEVNTGLAGAYIFSSGKNMGVFKGVGTPADIYDFFKLDEYEGYIWLAHNRFPTNTPGWWGGAHPFNILDWSIVHNGEISSYGINRRYLEHCGYACNMQTDSEVVAYLLDLLIRKHGLKVKEAALVLAPPYWAHVDHLGDRELQDKLTTLKIIYESAMLNGPFAVLGGFAKGLFSVTDNTKLRPLAVGQTGEYTYFASEISALYEMEPVLDKVITPRAGEPCMAMLEEKER